MDSTTGFDGSFLRYTLSADGTWYPHLVRTLWDATDSRTMLLFVFMLCLATLAHQGMGR